VFQPLPVGALVDTVPAMSDQWQARMLVPAGHVPRNGMGRLAAINVALLGMLPDVVRADLGIRGPDSTGDK
jgi:hypothetical protein